MTTDDSPALSRSWAHPRGAAPRDPRALDRALPAGEVERALALIRSWPGYVPTPLECLDGAARRAGVTAVLYKDEAPRFGVGTFKALGGRYAVQRRLEAAGLGGAEEAAFPTVCCASDGNHGRAVAWATALHGGRAVVYLPEHALAERERRIRALGADTVRVAGTYDHAVERVREDARANGWLLVADTGEDASDAGPLHVMAAYATIPEEVLESLQPDELPTHVFVQAGVGGLAAAVMTHLGRRLGTKAPRFVVIEPSNAPCVLTSLEAGREEPVAGGLDTVMDCLAAGEVSRAAWPVLSAWTDAALAVSDGWTRGVLADVQRGGMGDPPLDVGPSGVAGLAGLLAAAGQPEVQQAIGLDENARVLVIGTEEALPDGAS